MHDDRQNETFRLRLNNLTIANIQILKGYLTNKKFRLF